MSTVCLWSRSFKSEIASSGRLLRSLRPRQVSQPKQSAVGKLFRATGREDAFPCRPRWPGLLCRRGQRHAHTLAQNDEPAEQNLATTELTELFNKMDLNGNGVIELKEFIEVCQDELLLNFSEVELTRIFNTVDFEGIGALTFDNFRRGIANTFLFKSISIEYGRSSVHFDVPDNYDHQLPTCDVYRHPDYKQKDEHEKSAGGVTVHDPSKHGEVIGEFADIRRRIDYSWHTNYTSERQEWQDQIVRRVTQPRETVERPWVIFTCGAMGSGKGHVMQWLSRNGLFPLEEVVQIDADYFKSVMPEWKGYKEYDPLQAGTMCHDESGFLQEMAQEVALRTNSQIWIDGSMQDHAWYTHVFSDIRRHFPQYRLAIIYVYCSEEEVFRRAAERSKVTGRFVPSAKLREAIHKTRDSIRVLGPQCDFVAKVNNQERVPWLEVCEDRSHSFLSFKHHFDMHVETNTKRFPDCMPMRWLRRNEFLSSTVELPPGATNSNRLTMEAVSWESIGNEKLQELLAPFRSLPNGPLKLLLSPMSELNIDRRSRELAGVPDDANYCVFCHGAFFQDGSCVRAGEAALEGIPDSIKPLLQYPSFIYFDENCSVVGVNILLSSMAVTDRTDDSHSFIQFQAPRRLPTALAVRLQNTGRWVMPRGEFTTVFAASLAWLMPGELPECPFGALAYTLHDGRKTLFPLTSSF